MNIARSSRGDPRLTGNGGRLAWPWIKNVFLFIGGLVLVYPGGIALGLMLRISPDESPFGIYILIGMGANLITGLCFLLRRKMIQALAVSSPVAIILLIELLGRI